MEIFTLYTTSRSKKVREAAYRFAANLNRTPGRPIVQINIVFTRVTAVTTAKRRKGGKKLDWDWFASRFQGEKGGGVAFHFTPAQRKRWDLQRTVNGSRNSASKDQAMFWLCAEPGERAAGYTGLTEIERLLYHEMAHHDEDKDNLVGDQLPQEWVHDLDYEKKAIHTYPTLISFKDIETRHRLRDVLIEIAKRLLRKKKAN